VRISGERFRRASIVGPARLDRRDFQSTHDCETLISLSFSRSTERVNMLLLLLLLLPLLLISLHISFRKPREMSKLSTFA